MRRKDVAWRREPQGSGAATKGFSPELDGSPQGGRHCEMVVCAVALFGLVNGRRQPRRGRCRNSAQTSGSRHEATACRPLRGSRSPLAATRNRSGTRPPRCQSRPFTTPGRGSARLSSPKSVRAALELAPWKVSPSRNRARSFSPAIDHNHVEGQVLRKGIEIGGDVAYAT
jgi:hypothetical protein